jgi:hypothetical protein
MDLKNGEIESKNLNFLNFPKNTPDGWLQGCPMPNMNAIPRLEVEEMLE